MESLNGGIQIGGRSDIRTRYNIRGCAVEDCLTSCFCDPSQERREIELEENSFEGFPQLT